MTAPIEAVGYHVGIVVHDVEVAGQRYQRLLGGSFRSFRYDKPASRVAEAPWPPTRLRIAYGRYGGMTIELIQSLDDEGPREGRQGDEGSRGARAGDPRRDR